MSFDAKCNPSEAAYRAPVPAAGEEASLIASDASARNSTEKQSMPAGGPSKEDDADMMSDQYRLQQAAQMYQLMPAGAALNDLGEKPKAGEMGISETDTTGERELRDHIINDESALSLQAGTDVAKGKPVYSPDACARSRLRAAICIVIFVIAIAVGGLLIWRLAVSNSLADVAPDSAGAGNQGTCNHIDPVLLPLAAVSESLHAMCAIRSTPAVPIEHRFRSCDNLLNCSLF